VIDFGEQVAERRALDLTPMLDVIFLLLVFFLLTSIFARPLLELELPQAASGRAASEPEISLTILPDETLVLNDRLVSWGELPVVLEGLLAARKGERQVSLRSDRGVPFGRVVEVMDLAKRAGAENIAVVTERSP
jgi:biopolymer transport protein ExbD